MLISLSFCLFLGHLTNLKLASFCDLFILEVLPKLNWILEAPTVSRKNVT